MRRILLHTLIFSSYICGQVLILKDFALFDVAFCLIYLGYILGLSFETPTVGITVLGFTMGLIIDIFYDYLGLHAAALTALAFARNYWLARLVPQGGYDVGLYPTIKYHGLLWYITYALPLITLHHTVLFFLEAWGVHLFWHTVLKIGASSLFTLAGTLIIQYLSPQGRRV